MGLPNLSFFKMSLNLVCPGIIKQGSLKFVFMHVIQFCTIVLRPDHAVTEQG